MIESNDPETSKPIKRKIYEDEKDSEPNSMNRNNTSSNYVIGDGNNIDETELQVRKELIDFLTNKNIDISVINSYNIVVRRSSKKSSSYVFTSPDGSILETKGDVYTNIMKLNGSQALSKSNIDTLNIATRKSNYEELMLRTSNILRNLPIEIKGIRIFSLGKINVDNQFHNEVQIYPIGYKCEQNILISARGSGRQIAVICEIIEVEGDPEFLLTVKSTGQTYLASSESEVWKKLDNSFTDTLMPSFFNLDIELLIEGLTGSFDCKNYKFHVERGFGESYKTNEQSISSKNAYLLRLSREKRNMERQRRTSLDVAISNNDSAEDKLKEKLRREREREESQKRKEEIREQIKAQKDADRKIELQNKEKAKLSDKERRERSKAEEKFNNQLRKDAKSDVKKLQLESNQLIINYFDSEEETLEQCQSTQFNEKIVKKDSEICQSLNNIFDSIPDYLIQTDDAQIYGVTLISDILEISNALYLFKNYLNLQVDCKVDVLIEHLLTIQKYFIREEAIESSLEDNKIVNISKSFSYIERIYLCLVKSFMNQICDIEIINPNDKDAESGKKDRNIANVKFAVNQQSWSEFARIICLKYIFDEIQRPKDEIQAIIRGGKSIQNKSNIKSIIQYLRNRLFSRSFACVQNEDPRKLLRSNQRDLKYLDKEIIFDSEDEMFKALLLVLSDDKYPIAYSRCVKVFLKVVSCNQAKNFIWEVDKEVYPDYYSYISFPLCFANVASHLYNQLYGAEEQSVYESFEDAMRQVILNCISFNNEVSPLVTQAQKLNVVFYRHMDRWIWGNSPSINACDDMHCLYSSVRIESNDDVLKCTRCLGNFSFIKLSENTNVTTDWFSQLVILPKDYKVDEWFCPYCLREDSNSISNSTFYYENEWGFSSTLPWVLNSTYTNLTTFIEQEFPYLQHILDALSVLCNSSKTAFRSFDLKKTKLDLWNFDDHIKVLLGLSRCLLGDPGASDTLQTIANEMEKMLKLCSKSTFREADFIGIVKKIVGGEGADRCRSLLDGIVNETAEIKNDIIEGRCIFCFGSTYEEDNPDGLEILLCDGCDAESHLKCLNLNSVPQHEWFCPSCATRKASMDSRIKYTFKNFDEFKHKEEEEKLIDEYISQKASNELTNSSSSLDEPVCCYCGFTELELCSPFVVSNSREEHDAYVHSTLESNAAGIFKGFPNTSISFSINGVIQEPDEIDIPFFPLIKSSQGIKLVSAFKTINQIAPIAHEHCALQLFQVRLERFKHSQRRRRKIVSDNVILMSGLHVNSIGTDDDGRVYWKFPVSNDLFVCSGYPDIKERIEFNDLVGLSSKVSDSDKNLSWKRISDDNLIKQIASVLGNSNNEQLLRTNIINFILFERTALSVALQSNQNEENSDSHEDIDEEEVQNDEEEVDDQDGNIEESEQTNSRISARKKTPVPPAARSIDKSIDNTPVALKLLTDKGADILEYYSIPSEVVFEDIDVTSGEENHSFSEYFTYGSRRYYAIALMNSNDKRCKFNKDSNVVVTYQIKRDGDIDSLAYTPLSEQWTDNIYYFATANFKKSGNYTISFIAESSEFTNKIEPLSFRIKVESENIIHGLYHSLITLRAFNFMESPSRQILDQRRLLLDRVLSFKETSGEYLNEFEAAKIALLAVYAALPLGALLWNSDVTFTKKDVNFKFSLIESSGWDDNFDQVWRGAVESTESIEVLMECLLILETFINKDWLSSPYNALIQSLPLPHFALKSATISSICVRIFSLDKSLEYAKVYSQPRQSRTRIVKNTENFKHTSDYRDSRNDDIDEIPGKRSRRAAADNAFNRIREFFPVEEDHRVPKLRRTAKYEPDSDSEFESSGMVSMNKNSMNWICATCTVANDGRARSCSACGERKGFHIPADDVNSSKKGNLRRKNKSFDLDDDDDHYFDDYEVGKPSSIYPTIDISKEINDFSIKNVGESYLDTSIKIFKVLQKLYQDSSSMEFWIPVDQKLNPSYKNYVSEPMDFGSILKKHQRNEYLGDINLFLKDVDLVWQNCKTFNGEGSFFYNLASELSNKFSKIFESVMTGSNSDDSNNMPESTF